MQICIFWSKKPLFLYKYFADMHKNNIFTYLFFLIVFLSGCSDNHYYRLGGYAQGGTYSMKYKGADLSPEKMQAGADSLLQVIDRTLSGYNHHSLLSRFNAGDTITLTPMFARMYELAYGFWEESEGAFDAAFAPLFDLWGFGFKSATMPSEKQIQECLSTYGSGKLKNPEQINALIGKKVSGKDFLLCSTDSLPQLNFNAIAQGFSCDIIAQFLESHGVKDYLVDIGEIYCSGDGPGGKGWTIGIDNPVDGNDTPGADIRETWNSEGKSLGIVTSGNYRKFYIKDGKKYSHTIDPRTGHGVSHRLLSATVIAPTAGSADALATFFMVIGDGAAKEYLSSHPDIKACLITENEVWKNW